MTTLTLVLRRSDASGRRIVARDYDRLMVDQRAWTVAEVARPPLPFLLKSLLHG